MPSNILSSQIPQSFSNELFLSEYLDTELNHNYTSIYSIKFQIFGTEIFELGDREFTLKENNYLVVNNNQTVKSYSFKTKRAITVFIEPSTLADVLYNLTKDNEDLLSNPFGFIENEVIFLENCFEITDDSIGRELNYLSSSFDYIKARKFPFDENFFFKISKALILSHQDTFRYFLNIESAKKTTKLELFDRMHRAKQFITDNWNKSISLNSIASAVNMSPYHFNRTFSRVFQIPPMEYHLKLRLNKAKELLETQKYMVADVAQFAGYSDIFSFSKAFKKCFGFSPSLCNA